MNQKREYKKLFVLSIISVLMISLFIGFVSAQTTGKNSIGGLVNNVISGIVSILNPILGWALGADRINNDGFIIKLFFAIIVFAFVYVVLSKSFHKFFDDYKWAAWVISIAVPIISVRFMTPEWLNTLLMPNQTFLATVIILIPFVLFYFLTENWVGPARRSAWVIFAVVFFMIWGTVDQTLPSQNNGSSNVYPIAAVACLIMALFDGTIAQWRSRMQIERIKGGNKYATLIQYQTAMNNCTTAFKQFIGNNNINGYAGTTPSSQGQVGETAYLLDIEYYNKLMKKLA